MKKFSPEEIKAAKSVKDRALNEHSSQWFKSLYMAGEICMWDELQSEITALTAENEKLKAKIKNLNKGRLNLW